MENLDPEGYSEARGGQKRRADYEWDKYNNPREHAVTPEKEGVSIGSNPNNSKFDLIFSLTKSLK